MSDMTPRLALPLLLPSQAQKHVTHNEAIDRLDAIVQLAVAGFGATVPPAVPEEGLPWALGAAPVGAWAGHGGKLARWRNAGWDFITPQEGWLAWGIAEAEIRIWLGGAFVPLPVVPTGFVQNLSGLGIGAVADAVNRLSVNSPASLLNHAGQGHEATVNKAAAGHDAAIAFKTGFSARALAGLLGDDNWRLKVSPNGSTWYDALLADRATGRVTAPNGMVVTGSLTGTAVMQSATDTTAGRVMKTGDWGVGAALAPALPSNDFTAELREGFWRATEASSVGHPTTSAYNLAVLALRMGGSEAGGVGGHGVLTFRGAGATASNQRLRIGTRPSNTGALNWVEVLHNGRLVGTVSQSGGVPDGTAFEQGANANGEYIRFADGTQICAASVATLSSGGVTWTYPAVFSAAPRCLFGCSGGTVGFAVATNNTGTTVQVSAYNTSGARINGFAVGIAFGRWF